MTAGLGCFDPEHVSLPFHPFAGKEGFSQLTDVAWEPARTVWKMNMDPTNYKGVRSLDHLGLGPDLTLVACLSTGVCQAPCWTGLDWTGQEESSLVSRSQTSSSDSDRPTMSPVLSIAWTFLGQNEPGCALLKAPCNAGSKAEGALHRGRVLAHREPGWIPGLEDVGPR